MIAIPPPFGDNMRNVPEQKYSVCALDCPDTCALVLNIDAAGHATKIAGDPQHPITRGFLCGKVAKYLEREYHPDRLLYPMRRSGAKGEGKFTRITWDQALCEIAERLAAISREQGPEAILPYSYAGTMGVLNYGGMDRRFSPPRSLTPRPHHLLQHRRRGARCFAGGALRLGA